MELSYWGLTPDLWRTLSIVVQGLLGVILTGIGVIQLIALIRKSHETKITRTLDICKQHFTDPIIFECRCILYEARKNGDLDENPIKYRMRILQVLNFFEGLAIGIHQGIYDEQITYENLGGMVRITVQMYLTGDLPQRAEIGHSPKNYEHVRALAKKWNNLPNAPAIRKFATEIFKKSKAQETNKNDATKAVA